MAAILRTSAGIYFDLSTFNSTDCTVPSPITFLSSISYTSVNITLHEGMRTVAT